MSDGTDKIDMRFDALERKIESTYADMTREIIMWIVASYIAVAAAFVIFII